MLKTRKPWLNIATWSVPLRWTVAVLVVPVLLPACVMVVASSGLLVEKDILRLVIVAVAYTLIFSILGVWLLFPLLYFLIDQRERHTLEVYMRSAVIGALAATLIFTFAIAVIFPVPVFLLGIMFLGFVIAVPYAALTSRLIWCVLWKGREPA